MLLTPRAADQEQVPSDPQNRELEQALRELEEVAKGFVVNYATRLLNDAQLRQDYFRRVSRAAGEFREAVDQGRLTPSEAATAAQALRNEIMELTRRRTSDLGRAICEKVKRTGKTLGELLDRYAEKRFSKAFLQLTEAERNAVYMDVVAASGRPDPKWIKTAATWGRYGTGLFVLSIGIAVYDVSVSGDPVRAASRQAGVAGFGYLGSLGGGALAGLACGPGMPVCSAVGLIAGGVAAAMGGDWLIGWLTSR